MLKLKRLLKSFIYAGRGLLKVFHEEQNFKIELTVGLIVLLLAWWVRVNYLELCVLIVIIALVLMMEVVNSAVELVSDVLKPKLDHYVKEIKDIVAAGVMLSSVAAVIIGLIILGRHLLEYWQK